MNYKTRRRQILAMRYRVQTQRPKSRSDNLSFLRGREGDALSPPQPIRSFVPLLRLLCTLLR